MVNAMLRRLVAVADLSLDKEMLQRDLEKP
jgi:hypothetical protein